MPAPRTAVVFTGGDAPGEAAVASLPLDRFVVAADSGLEHARRLGVAVDLAVGDFDSVDADVLAAAETAGTRVERHPAEKDKTDLELALLAAASTGAARLIVIGGHGGRLDHWLGNVAVLASDAFAATPIEVRSGTSRLFVVRDEATFEGEHGEYVSLLAWNGPAHIVRTEGLRWKLVDERLDAGSSRGFSNELVASRAQVCVGDGVVIVVLPGERSPLAAGGADPGPALAE